MPRPRASAVPGALVPTVASDQSAPGDEHHALGPALQGGVALHPEQPADLVPHGHQHSAVVARQDQELVDHGHDGCQRVLPPVFFEFFAVHGQRRLGVVRVGVQLRGTPPRLLDQGAECRAVAGSPGSRVPGSPVARGRRWHAAGAALRGPRLLAVTVLPDGPGSSLNSHWTGSTACRRPPRPAQSSSRRACRVRTRQGRRRAVSGGPGYPREISIMSSRGTTLMRSRSIPLADSAADHSAPRASSWASSLIHPSHVVYSMPRS